MPRAKVGFIKITSGNPINDRGGVIYGNTTPNETTITANVNLGVAGRQKFMPGHVPLAGSASASGVGLSRALSSGNYALMTKAKFVMYLAASELAGIPNLILRPGNSKIGRSKPINYIEAFRTTQDIAAGWNYVTGALLSTPSVTNDTMKNIDGGAVVDQAAHPSRAVPGELVYLDGGRSVVFKDYPAKNGN